MLKQLRYRDSHYTILGMTIQETRGHMYVTIQCHEQNLSVEVNLANPNDPIKVDKLHNYAQQVMDYLASSDYTPLVINTLTSVFSESGSETIVSAKSLYTEHKTTIDPKDYFYGYVYSDLDNTVKVIPFEKDKFEIERASIRTTHWHVRSKLANKSLSIDVGGIADEVAMTVRECVTVINDRVHDKVRRGVPVIDFTELVVDNFNNWGYHETTLLVVS